MDTARHYRQKMILDNFLISALRGHDTMLMSVNGIFFSL